MRRCSPTRHPFTATETVRCRAEKNFWTTARQLQRWWSRKYKLPLNHPLCIGQAEGELRQEFIEDLLERRHDLEQEIKETKGADLSAIERQLGGVLRALGEEPEEEYDPLIEQWEKDIEAGLDPYVEEPKWPIKK